jgi:ATP-dependent RNA helicase DeaD
MWHHNQTTPPMPKKKPAPFIPKPEGRASRTDYKASDGHPSPPQPKSKRGNRNNPNPQKPRAINSPKPQPTVVEPTGFDTLGLRDETLKALSDLGFEIATPIQTLAIPLLLTGCDLIGLAQTGTGKTAAFGLPLIEKIDPKDLTTQALVLAPTRELALQVAKGIHEFAKYGNLRVVPVVGGQPIDRQFRALKQGSQIVVGTPGRVLDHMRRGSLRLDGVRYCVLDEADEMMALGFTEDMEAILAELPDSRQLAFFSATMPPRVLAITGKFLRNPKRVEIVAKQRTLETTNQTYYEVPPGKKQEALVRVLDMETPGSTIVFCRTRLETAELSDALSFYGYNAEAIHGDMGQADRDRVLRRFREGLADLLVATDVAARGLDIEHVTHVINYDVPYDAEQYIHRIGRTGRAGRTGDAITLIYPRERRLLAMIERLIGSPIEPARIPTIDDIAAQRRKAFVERLRDSLNEREFDSMLPCVGELAEEFDPHQVAAAALYMLWKELHQSAPPADEEDVFAEFEQPEMGMVRIFVGMGRQDGLRPGDLVGAISNEAGLPGREIGVIEVLEHSAFVEVPASEGARVIEALSRTKLRNRKVKVQLAKPGLPQPAPVHSSSKKDASRGGERPSGKRKNLDKRR